MAKKKKKALTLLRARKIFLKENFVENYPIVGSKYWVRTISKLNYKDFWLLYYVVEGLLLRKYPDDIIEKLLTLDRNQLLQMKTVLEVLRKTCDPAKKPDEESPFSLIYEGHDYDLEKPPPKKRKKIDKPKKLGKNQRILLKVLKENFENNEEFKAKTVKRLLDDEMPNVNGILKVLAEKTDNVEVIGKKKYRYVT